MKPAAKPATCAQKPTPPAGSPPVAVAIEPTPPAEIPVQPGRNYFHLQKAGEHWDAVKSSRTMSIYIPPEFTGLKLELMAVKE